MKNRCLLFIILFFSISCDRKENSQISLNKEVLTIVGNYIHEHPQWNTFILQPTSKTLEERPDLKNGFIIGPGYPSMFKGLNSRNLSFHIDIDDKRVYYIGKINSIVKVDSLDNWTNQNQEDSVELVFPNIHLTKDKESAYATIEKRWIKDPIVRFYYYGCYFYLDKNSWHIHKERADTLFLPQCKSAILFNPKKSL